MYSTKVAMSKKNTFRQYGYWSSRKFKLMTVSVCQFSILLFFWLLYICSDLMLSNMLGSREHRNVRMVCLQDLFFQFLHWDSPRPLAAPAQREQFSCCNTARTALLGSAYLVLKPGCLSWWFWGWGRRKRGHGIEYYYPRFTNDKTEAHIM